VFSNNNNNIDLVRCYNHIQRPQVAVVENGLKILRVAANILNTQPRTVDSGWSYNLRVG